MKFSEYKLREELHKSLQDAGYETPTPIQEQAIPIVLDGTDLIGVAETGTGKTLAFLLPVFHSFKPGLHDPQALVICPTRELAIQVAREAEKFGKHLGVRTVLLYGGTSSGDQKRQLMEGVDLVVGTPGRLLDFVNSAWLSLRKLRAVILDEADRMLDMGFIKDVDAILRRAPMSRQTLLFSATISEEIRKLSSRYMHDPKIVRTHTGTRVTDNVDHVLYPVRSSQKIALLKALLKRETFEKALIFTATREGTSELGSSLRRWGYEVVSLSSLLSQSNRERALEAFRSGALPVLVATDVAARGLDVVDVDLVVNFDVPMQAEDYVHRVGRTGRAENRGRAITLVSEKDRRRVGDIERLLDKKIERIELDSFNYDEIPRDDGRSRDSRGRRPGGRARGRSGGRSSGRSGGRGSSRDSGSKSSGAKTATKPRRKRRPPKKKNSS